MIEFATIGLIALLGAMAPGPDFFIVVRNAIAYDRQAGLWTTLGIALGVLFHASYCILGLAVIISQSLLAFSLIKYIGAGYLIFLGVKALLSKSQPQRLEVAHVAPQLSFRQALAQGFLCNALNPKATLFILGVFTLAITPETTTMTQVVYGLEMFCITLLWFATLVLLLSQSAVKSRMQRAQVVISKLMGGLLLLFGINLLLHEQ